MSDSNEISTLQPTDMAMGVFSSVSMYGDYHKIAKDLASSTLIPAEFQNKPANVMIALNLSSRMQADPLAIMQSMYIVHGKPSFSASFIGGIVEQSGKFGFLEYRYQNEPEAGKPPGDDYGCRIVTTVASSGQEIQGPLITVKMAKAEGWWGKSGSKWPSLTETMLGNRAITFFARRYAGSILLGMSSTDELEDIRDVNPAPTRKPTTKADLEDAITGEAEVVVEQEVSRETSAEEKPKNPKKTKADKKAEEKHQDDAPVETDDGESGGNAAQDGGDTGNPWTVDELVNIIEKADTIDVVNDALSNTSGFSSPDQKKVLKAAQAKNKELAKGKS